MAQTGSSPLSRGIRVPVWKPTFSVRIIPALAGNTGCQNSRGAHRRDHPRSRGEYSPNSAPSGTNSGSSPLSRGIPASARSLFVLIRIIPALAGNTGPGITKVPGVRDHPRSRGEYCTYTTINGVLFGSSPLSRGIQPFTKNDSYTFRIIPALAGNTLPKVSAFKTNRDHPRSRGEYLCAKSQGIYSRGSSPLSRGIRLFRARQ